MTTHVNTHVTTHVSTPGTSPSAHAPSGDLAGKHVLVCVTGGIASYKAAGVVSALVQRGCKVTVAMTPGATRFVTPLTFQALSGRPVYTSVWESIESHDPQHIALARSINAAVVAPCTMDCLARLAHGRGDDVVSLILSAVDRAKTPVLLAPSMNSVMWAQASTQRNVATLRSDGFKIVGPAEGWQACRTSGPGRMSEPEELVRELVESFEIGKN